MAQGSVSALTDTHRVLDVVIVPETLPRLSMKVTRSLGRC